MWSMAFPGIAACFCVTALSDGSGRTTPGVPLPGPQAICDGARRHSPDLARLRELWDRPYNWTRRNAPICVSDHSQERANATHRRSTRRRGISRTRRALAAGVATTGRILRRFAPGPQVETRCEVGSCIVERCSERD